MRKSIKTMSILSGEYRNNIPGERWKIKSDEDKLSVTRLPKL